MVFFNYATMQMAAKIVYYGPGLCGKTTNLHHIYAKTSPQSRGEMVSLETETDRTLFFDLLPIDVGVIGGFKTRLQLYTVPGQVFYNTTRKLVLKGVDGIVFVADSQRAMLEANVESLKNLRENLAEIGTNLDEIPLVLQLNKRDLPNIATVDMMLDAMDPERRAESVESVASAGAGVFETLKLISKLTLRTLRRRMTGEEPSRASSTRSGQFRVQDNSRTMAGATPVPAVPTPPPAPAPAPVHAQAGAPTGRGTEPMRAMTGESPVQAAPAPAPTPTLVEEAPAPLPPEPEFDADATIAAASIDRRFIMDAPEPEREPIVEVVAPSPVEASPVIAERDLALDEPLGELHIPDSQPDSQPQSQPEPEPAPEAPVAAPVAAADDFSFDTPLETAFVAELEPEPGPEPEAKPEVKTVKVRNSVDVMAELEALRKRATNNPTAKTTAKRDVLADLNSLRPKRDLNRTLHLQLPPGVLSRTKTVRVTLAFEDGEEAIIDTQNQQVELGDASDVQSLSVNLKIDLA
jgi:mutual gliding-motility protein MglA